VKWITDKPEAIEDILAKMRSQMQITLNRFTISLERMTRSSIVDLVGEDSVICDIHRA
jgi:hypothetical protein